MAFYQKSVHTRTVAGGLFELTQPLDYYCEKFDREIHVPIGMKTDFASIPRVVRVLINRNGKSRKAAVLHDYLYRYHQRELNRKDADDIFLEAMTSDKVNVLVRYAMYAGVRAGGWLYYNKNAVVK